MVLESVVLDRDVGVQEMQGVVGEGCRNAVGHDSSMARMMASSV